VEIISTNRRPQRNLPAITWQVLTTKPTQ